MASLQDTRRRRRERLRFQLKKKANGRPRLSVFRANLNIHAQIIDDSQGKTLASASTLEKEFRASGEKGSNVEAAAKIGQMIADRALKAGVKEVVFDRGSYLYHGRVKALAEAAREKGLSF